MKLINKFVNRELIVNVLFAIAVLSLVLEADLANKQILMHLPI